jgi:hypothetical protein
MSEAHLFNIAGHALVGCASAVANRGRCGSGALSGAVGSFAGPLLTGLRFESNLIATSVLGGLASVAGGGKFANGAITGAFGYLFNATAGQGHNGGPPLDEEIINRPPFPSLGRMFGVIGGALLLYEFLEWTMPPIQEVQIYAIGRVWDTGAARELLGYETLNIPDWSLARNDAWIRQIIDEGAPVYIASPQTAENLWDSVNQRPTVFARELSQLIQAGYRQVGDYMVPRPR